MVGKAVFLVGVPGVVGGFLEGEASVALGDFAASVALGDLAATFFGLRLPSSSFALLTGDLGLAGGFSLGLSSCFALLGAALGLTPALGLTDARGLTPFLVGDLASFGFVDDGRGARIGILASAGLLSISPKSCLFLWWALALLTLSPCPLFVIDRIEREFVERDSAFVDQPSIMGTKWCDNASIVHVVFTLWPAFFRAKGDDVYWCHEE